VNRDAALYVSDQEAPQKLVKLAIESARDDDKLRQLSTNVKKMALPDSAAIIAKEVIKLAEGK
jgi:UDP-N-acetylglucosamine--N-acetylmuramyl-(pentapeptide) pyrophosphoryl-undecaprenol N-acetylglucosamine transferase